MKRDTVKTLVGLVVIAGIVVATFLYGNSQRQAQLRHDQDVKKQQTASVNTMTPASPAATKTATPAPAPTATPQVAANSTNTAPVKTPATNALQGSGGSGAALGTTASPTPLPAVTPATGGTNQSGLPQTGPGTVGLVGLSLIAFMIWAVRNSRRAALAAARGRRL